MAILMQGLTNSRGSLLSYCILLLALNGNGQNIHLSFTGATAIQHVQLDSIRIENTSQGCDTTVYWPDTVLNLLYTGSTAANAALDQGFRITRVSPNPFYEQGTVALFLPEAGLLEVGLHDLQGRVMGVYSGQMSPGHHRFSFQAGDRGVFILQARYKGQVRATRLISLGHGKAFGLSYQGCTSGQAGMKAGLPIALPFLYSLGDTLFCWGYGAGQSAGFVSFLVASGSFSFTFDQGSPCQATPFVVHLGLIYHTVQIGTQCWFRENLNAGIMVTDHLTSYNHNHCSNNGIIEKYCYNNDPAMCDIYGGLYDWNEMMNYDTLPGGQGICPLGWHIPSDTDYCVLTTFLDTVVDCDTMAWSGSNAGQKLKESGLVHWNSPNTGATNSSGFTGLAGGVRVNLGYTTDLGAATTLWTSQTAFPASFGLVRVLTSYQLGVYRFKGNKTHGYAVRCIKDN